ncbi:CAZyme family GH131 [Penicillium chrysogenum]|uniref:CAZyme family GH131 n=1 Tax=Penicillium chrysogenum TaxID=5076 RepID=A0ABQ8W9P0_PENCH|nr:CAZyme family GH131 [Penicillium chrysogenum]KAJ5238177.1 CAZyme family GH131 [Penicillium chrysogenum]KAJ5261555.1 CAZyme family GH131 [Penicillium chrysogenum]KAJ5278478.1 CAZyme family GH131 [Penicillium chrysogenum]KAJ6159480.1 CAZyme family GH131 [Penicillium chrysogenum]
MRSLAWLLSLPIAAEAGEVLWSGFFNASATVADFDKWSWSNQVGDWQWYIHGSASTETYLGLSPDNKNPADTSDEQGIRITIDGTSFWNGQTMERSEIIPQTKADLGSGHLFYHFSLKTEDTNAPNPNFEHQIAFFESHFTELKYGTASGASGKDNTLRWCVGGVSKWETDLEAGKWYNFAYDIDFDAKTVGLWASNGADDLKQVVSAVSASTSTNSADWHVGELRLPNGGSDAAAEDWFWSGLFVEKAPITPGIAGPA